jgi:hypothetical protein
VAFAASIGGLATPIGTPPNLIGLAFIRDQVGVTVSFFGWCAIGVPLVAVLTTFAVAVLTRMFPAGIERLEGVGQYVAVERQRLGGWTVGQQSVAAAFALTVAMWVLPGLLLLAFGAAHPLCIWLGKRLPEGVAALIGAILLFLLPGDVDESGRRRRALEWREARLDWDIVLLYGGGLALGELCFSTGLAGAIGRSITGWIPAGEWSGPALVAVAAMVAVLTSEFTSNTASANMVVPVVIALSRAIGVDPLVPALAATFGSSLGFMMPVSTPCNAIVYGSGRVPLRAMMAGGHRRGGCHHRHAGDAVGITSLRRGCAAAADHPTGRKAAARPVHVLRPDRVRGVDFRCHAGVAAMGLRDSGGPEPRVARSLLRSPRRTGGSGGAPAGRATAWSHPGRGRAAAAGRAAASRSRCASSGAAGRDGPGTRSSLCSTAAACRTGGPVRCHAREAAATTAAAGRRGSRSRPPAIPSP